jgi:hypothetical protein
LGIIFLSENKGGSPHSSRARTPLRFGADSAT